MNINEVYQEAWITVLDELTRCGITEKDLIEILNDDYVEWKGMQGFLGGYAAAKGFGINNDEGSWLDEKLKGE
jgi:hypothetical protein